MTHHLTWPRRRWRLACTAAAALLSGCMGIDVTSVQRAEPSVHAPAPERAVITGRIRHVVDGQPLEYGLLDKPHLSLYHRQRGVLMSTPETASDGRFRWQLPPGEYVVATLFGGMAPTRQPLRLPSGGMLRVNGLVDPGLGFELRPGSVVDLGTLVVEVESRPAAGLLGGGGRVFGRLTGLRVEAAPAGLATRPADERPFAASGADAHPHPAVLAPLLPLLMR